MVIMPEWQGRAWNEVLNATCEFWLRGENR